MEDFAPARCGHHAGRGLPGWQESFGEGTFLGNSDFPNDDASHLSVDEGFSATLREHGPSDERYPGREKTSKEGKKRDGH